jgi:hypothetical protein
MKKPARCICEVVPLFQSDAERFLGRELVSNDERLTCYNELITQLSSLSLDPCGDVKLSFAKSDFTSYSKFVNLLTLAFPQIPYLLTCDDVDYIVIMRKDVLLKYFIYSDFLCIRSFD